MIELLPGFLLLLGVPAAAVSTYIATIPCRLLVSRRRQPGWYIAVVVAVLLGALAVLLLGGADLFHPSRWDTGKVTMREMAPMWFAAAAIGAFIPAWYVVGHYRDKLEHTNDTF
jgi:hypothetical protein